MCVFMVSGYLRYTNPNENKKYVVLWDMQLSFVRPFLRYVGVIWFVFHIFPTSFTHIYTAQRVLYWQLYNETYVKIGLTIKPLFI